MGFEPEKLSVFQSLGKLKRYVVNHMGFLFNNNNRLEMAEEVGFEPTMGVNPCRFSRPVHSTALPLFLV